MPQVGEGNPATKVVFDPSLGRHGGSRYRGAGCRFTPTSQGIPEEDMNSGLKYSVSGGLDLAAMPINSKAWQLQHVLRQLACELEGGVDN